MIPNPRCDLEGRTVIITGGGKEIGKIHAQEFAKSGAHLVAADIDGESAGAVARVWEGVPNRLHFTTSKAGVIGFTRAMAHEVGPLGITVNAITPGYKPGETQVQSSSGNYLAAQAEGRAMGPAQYPEDLVGAVMFLSSQAGDYMTGQTINVDGGKAMH
ncbi:MAG: fabG [Hyphomicrobiales bacterium]|jgi:NAD(P)-dependent dehydrogenase (short-subunit alcohol dehydrogenase family)|nr:fabG [Hyphomicrobiales bacterium]